MTALVLPRFVMPDPWRLLRPLKLDGQWSPRQRVQFQDADPGVHSIGPDPYYEDKNVYEIATGLGLSSGLKLALDAGAASSYASGQSWLDLTANGYDFFRGSTGSTESTDPTFNGSSGGLSLSEYWSSDGGDYFTYDSSNETWMNKLHKNNAKYSILVGLYHGDTLGIPYALFVTQNAGGNSVGISVWIQNYGLIWRWGNGTSGGSKGHNTISNDRYTIAGVSVDESSATGGWAMANGDFTNFNPTYTSPSTASSAATLSIGSFEGLYPMPSAAKYYFVLAWEGVALSKSQMTAAYNALRLRLGI